MRVNNIHKLGDYQKLLTRNPAELPTLLKSLKMHISDFFQEPEVFFAIEDAILPKLLLNSEIRVLAENDEKGYIAYSFAMMLYFLKQERQKSFSLRITAQHRDIKPDNHAGDILYPHLITMDLSPRCLDLFFDATPEGYQVKKVLHKSVILESEKLQNLSNSNGYNLLFAARKQQDHSQIEVYYRLLNPGGYLIFKPTVPTEKFVCLFRCN